MTNFSKKWIYIYIKHLKKSGDDSSFWSNDIDDDEEGRRSWRSFEDEKKSKFVAEIKREKTEASAVVAKERVADEQKKRTGKTKEW